VARVFTGAEDGLTVGQIRALLHRQHQTSLFRRFPDVLENIQDLQQDLDSGRRLPRDLWHHRRPDPRRCLG